MEASIFSRSKKPTSIAGEVRILWLVGLLIVRVIGVHFDIAVGVSWAVIIQIVVFITGFPFRKELMIGGMFEGVDG
jgi:hypothetical protein